MNSCALNDTSALNFVQIVSSVSVILMILGVLWLFNVSFTIAEFTVKQMSKKMALMIEQRRARRTPADRQE